MAGPRNDRLNDYPLSTAITIVPLLFWVCVLGKWLIGFNLIHWLADSITSGLGVPGFQFLAGMEIDDARVLTIATLATVGLVVWIAYQIWDYKVLRKRRIIVRGSVKRISWEGDQATLLFDYDHANQTYSTRATVAQKIGQFASQTGQVFLQIDPKDPTKILVLRPDPVVVERAV